MADRYYVNFPLNPGEVLLQGPEAHHLATVLRARPGDTVILFNGEGGEYPATVVAVQRKVVVLNVGPAVTADRELPGGLEVAACVPKGDRGDFLVEKLTEIGVTRFVPLRTQRSIVHPRTDRLRRTVIEASKQCGRNRLMEVAEVTDAAAYWNETKDGLRLIAHLGGKLAPTPTLPVNIAVGPEGGFTDDEVAAALAAGWQPVDLGPRILRVETAAIAMAAYWGLGSAIRA